MEDVRTALKEAGRGGWRVDLEAIEAVAAKCVAEQKKKFSVDGKGDSAEITQKDS